MSWIKIIMMMAAVIMTIELTAARGADHGNGGNVSIKATETSWLKIAAARIASDGREASSPWPRRFSDFLERLQRCNPQDWPQ
jgi:hypothetical protein